MRQVALVTGASRGIGAAVARALARDGFDIWLNYNTSEDAARSVAGDLEKLGAGCRLLRFDVTDSQAVEEALLPLLKEQAPYVLVNNAGFAKDGVMAMMSPQEWQSVLAVHLNGFYNVTHALLPVMLKKRKGRIINMVSVSGQTGVGGQVNYSAAKAGLIGATRSLAVEIGRRNITVNAVAPGFIETDMTSHLPKDEIVKAIPLGRVGQAEEVAEAVSFLCSDRAAYITGQVLGMSGGLLM